MRISDWSSDVCSSDLEVMYPEVRKLLPDLEDDILESYEEHHVADLLCAELAAMDASDERFVAKTTVLIENVEHHVEEEEQRSEEGRVGKGGVRTCRARWSP